MRYLGIDPGKKGALVIMDSMRKILDMVPMPMHKTTYDLVTLRSYLIENKIRYVFVEKVHAIKGASSKSTFEFGFGAGILHGMLSGLQIPHFYVRPKEWQKYAHRGVDGSDPKEKSLQSAQMRWPGTNWYWNRQSKPHDGFVDAALICEYGIAQIVNNERMEI